MAQDREPICITCGLPTGSPPKINFLEDGETCPTCRERVLDALPPALPGSKVPQPEELEPRDNVAPLELAPGDGYPEPPMRA